MDWTFLRRLLAPQGMSVGLPKVPETKPTADLTDEELRSLTRPRWTGQPTPDEWKTYLQMLRGTP